jgi:hypothetical protein
MPCPRTKRGENHECQDYAEVWSRYWARVCSRGGALIASPADAATRASASAAVLKMPNTIQAKTATAEATVTYKCTNDATTTYYILASVSQGTPGTESYAHYGQGDRNAPGTGPMEATCTGKKVTLTIVLYTWSAGAGTAPLAEGRGSFSFSLSSRAPGYAGYYGEHGTGPSFTSTRTVKVTTSV